MAKVTIEKLAQMVANGFSELSKSLGKRIDGTNESLGKRIDETNESVKSLRAEIDINFEEIGIDLRYAKEDLKEVRRDVTEVKDKVIPPIEFEDLMSRVKYVEEKMGIESGK